MGQGLTGFIFYGDAARHSRSLSMTASSTAFPIGDSLCSGSWPTIDLASFATQSCALPATIVSDGADSTPTPINGCRSWNGQ